MSKPRVKFTIAVDGRVGWRERTLTWRVQQLAKKTMIRLPSDVVSEVLATGQRLQIGVTFDEVYDTPTDDTLRTVRYAMLALASTDFKPLFERARLIWNWEEWQAYEQQLFDVALEHAKVVETNFWGERAPCPFCGDVPSAPGPSEGWAYPSGLLWHLEGKGNTRRCDVTKALEDWWRYR